MAPLWSQRSQAANVQRALALGVGVPGRGDRDFNPTCVGGRRASKHVSTRACRCSLVLGIWAPWRAPYVWVGGVPIAGMQSFSAVPRGLQANTLKNAWLRNELTPAEPKCSQNGESSTWTQHHATRMAALDEGAAMQTPRVLVETKGSAAIGRFVLNTLGLGRCDQSSWATRPKS